MARSHQHRDEPPAARAEAAEGGCGFAGPPADGGLSIDRLARAFATMMGTAPAESPAAAIEVDVTPDLDGGDAVGDDAVRVGPLSILEALLFVGLPDGRPLSARVAAGLMRGVRSEEVADLAAGLGRRYRAENRPYEVVSHEDGWVLRLRPEFAQFGAVLEQRTRTVRLAPDELDALAVVAWNQPVPRDRLVELGCDAAPAVLRRLVRRGLLELRTPKPGGADGPTYHTTPKFLEVFRLESLADLPDPSAPPP